MAGKFKLDFKHFKKVAADKESTTMQHPDGHTIKIAHSALSPQMRGDLAAIPVQKLAMGGEAEGPAQDASDHPIREAAQYVAGDTPAKGDEIEPTSSPVDLVAGGVGSAIGSKIAAPLAEGAGALMADEAGYFKIPGSLPSTSAATPETIAAAQTASTDALASGKNIGDINYRRAAANVNRKVSQMSKDFRPKRNPTPKFADGGDVDSQASNSQDSPEQIAKDASQIQPAQQPAPPVINVNVGGQPQPDAQAKAYGQAYGISPQRQAPQPVEVPQDAQGAAYAQAYNKSLEPEPSQMPQDAPGTPPQGQPVPTPQQAQESNPMANSAGLTLDTAMAGINQQKAGLQGQALAQQAQGDRDNQIAAHQARTDQENIDSYKSNYDNLMQHQREARQVLEQQHITPENYWKDHSRLMTGIGLILGGLHQGDGGNQVSNFIQNQMQMNLEAQKAELGKNENLLAANLRQFGNLRDATDMTRVQQNELMASQFRQSAAKSQSASAAPIALAAIGKLNENSAATIGQMAMRKTLLGAMGNGSVKPAQFVEWAIPPEARPAARKELKEADDAIALRDNTLQAFDQLAKLNTIGNRFGSPLQTGKQVDAIRGAALDKLTKDVSGRVTPETVKLIGGMFDTKFASPKTMAIERQRLNALLSQGMHYPTLEGYGMDMNKYGAFNPQGQSRIPVGKPVPNR